MFSIDVQFFSLPSVARDAGIGDLFRCLDIWPAVSTKWTLFSVQQFFFFPAKKYLQSSHYKN